MSNTAFSPVYAATYDHVGVILWGLAKLEAALDKQIDRLARYPNFRAGWDHEAYTYDYLAEHAPALLEKLKESLKQFNGRLGVGSSTYGQPLSMFIDGESNIRHLTFAMDAAEKHLGQSISIYIMSEHAFHAQMPQLLAGCGFRGAILRTHFMMYGHNPEFDEPVGWWRGIDGSQLPAVPTYRGQASVPARFIWKIGGPVCTVDNRILTDSISERCEWTLDDFRRQFGEHIRPLVASRADDIRSEESLIAAHQHDADIRWVTLEDLFALLPQPRATFDIAPNGYKVRMPWGYCGNWMWNRCRDAEVRVQTAERLAAIAGVTSDELTAAWKSLLVAQHHDIQICGLEDDARKFLSQSIEASDRVITGAMGTIAPRIGHGKRHVLFNPLNWDRQEYISVDGRDQVVRVPALGFIAVTPSEDAPRENQLAWTPDAQEPSLHILVRTTADGTTKWLRQPEKLGHVLTPFYDVYTSHTGGFRLIRDRASGRDLLLPPKTSGTLAAVINGQDCVSSGRFDDVTIRQHAVVLRESGKIGPLPYSSTWTFYAHARRIDWHGEVTFDGEHVGREAQSGDPQRTVTAFNDHEHKLRLRFYPFVGPYAFGVRDLPFHIAATNDAYVEGLYWTAVNDERIGLALFNAGQMGSVREEEGAFSSVLAFSLPYVWGTRLLKGTYSYRLGILPFVGPWQSANLHRHAMEHNFPCIGHDTSEEHDHLGGTWSPYSPGEPNDAVLTALYTVNGRTFARFCNYTDKPARVSLRWMGRPARLTLADLRSRLLAEVGASHTLGPWQVQTFALA